MNVVLHSEIHAQNHTGPLRPEVCSYRVYLKALAKQKLPQQYYIEFKSAHKSKFEKDCPCIGQIVKADVNQEDIGALVINGNIDGDDANKLVTLEPNKWKAVLSYGITEDPKLKTGFSIVFDLLDTTGVHTLPFKNTNNLEIQELCGWRPATPPIGRVGIK